MIPQSVWSDFGPDVINAILAGLIAGLVAVAVLRGTQRHERSLREEERRAAQLQERKRVVGRLILPIRDLADLMESRNLDKVRRVPTYGLRNQIALAELDLGNHPLLARAQAYVTYIREVRIWLDHALSGSQGGDFGNSRSSVARELTRHREQIRAYAVALETEFKAEINGEKVDAKYPPLEGVFATVEP